MITDYHAKYYALELTLNHAANGVERLSQSLFDASVDLNPHQIEAALFALKNPLNKGVVLADEVGLGKTIEAALVLSQYWAERKRHLIIICPASLRRQWAAELKDKFNLPSQILDARTLRQLKKDGIYNPISQKKVIIMSFHYAAKLEEQLINIPWDLVVIDEAHKLRNSHRLKNRMGQSLKRALDGRQKLLLTATPLQNSLMELYGLSTVIDEYLFGDDKAFRKQYMSSKADLPELKERLNSFVHRTLRKNVLEYVPYTERKTITQPFNPTNQEQNLYEEISKFLLKEDSWALPKQQKHLTSLILRKLLASSSHAVVNTLATIKSRLESLRDNKEQEDNFLEKLIDDEDIKEEYLEDEDFFITLEKEPPQDQNTKKARDKDLKEIQTEIEEITGFIQQAKSIKTDTKANALLKGLDLGFARMAEMGAARKVIIFTESRRTQEYLNDFLITNGYEGKIVSFSGNNNGEQARSIFEEWKIVNAGAEKITNSAQIDKRTALIDYFRTDAEIMIATEAAAEGVNLQFCSLIINYDLPWNPQRVEQRIGRCHRYGQKHDVVVINFLNKRNHADRRVLELLTEKFNLFDGVFGASDEVLGQVDNGIDFEKRIQKIYDTCRLPEDIEAAFLTLQEELESNITDKMKKTQKLLIENFDEDIHDLLRLQLAEAEKRLDKIARLFWQLTKHQLRNHATFDDIFYRFNLKTMPKNMDDLECHFGNYELIQKGQEATPNHQIYRMNHMLGEYVIDSAKKIDLMPAGIIFDYSQHPTKISVLEQLKRKSGVLILNKLSIQSFQNEEHLLFSAITKGGEIIDQETCEKLFVCSGKVDSQALEATSASLNNLAEVSDRQVSAKISQVLEVNNQHFQSERDRLEKWADDKIASAEQDLQETKAKIKGLKRESRQAQTIEEQKDLQEKIKQEERKQRSQRQKIFDVEDEIIEKRDELIDALQERLTQTTNIEHLFTIHWRVV